jgi:hypothetical protein
MASDRTSKDHYCVDYCQPPDHADLCHSGTEWRDDLSAHYEFEETYWRLYRVVVTKVQRLPDLDGDKPQTDLRGRKVNQVNLYESDSPTHYAYMVRWRGDVNRERNHYKRQHDFRAIYGKHCPASCPICRSDDRPQGE